MNELLTELRHDFFGLRFFIGLRLDKIRRAIRNRGIKLWWYRLWIREDEFHSSLDMDVEAMIGISEEKRKKYIDDLARRQHIAHVRDLKKINSPFARL